jgi:ubiquinone/menaquinone biosynthesis C-methylase UbiE
MNDVMSFGVHRLWKDYFVQKLYPVPGMTLLDVAGGTGIPYLPCTSHRNS